VTLFAITGGLQTPLAALLALIAAAYLATADRRRRAWLGCAVLAIAPLALAASVIGDDEGSLPHLSAPLIGLGVLFGGVVVVASAAGFVRWPRAVAPAAVIALSFRVPLGVGGQSVKLLLPLYLVIAAAVLAEAWRAFSEAEQSEVRERRRLDVALAVVVALYGLQALYSSDPAVAVRNLAFFYAPFALLYGLLSRLRWDRQMVAACLQSAVALALLFVLAGFVEYTRGRYLITPGGIQPNDFDPYFRIQSLFFDPNIFGRFLAVVMALTATALLRVGGAARVSAYALTLAVLWAGLVLTLSQSSFLALLAGLAVIASYQWSFRRVAIIGATLAVLGVGAALAFPSALKVDLGSQRAIERTTSGRFDLISGGAELYWRKPVFGNGSGSFAKEFSDRGLAGDDGVGETTTTKSHTAPLTVAAEQGVVGLAALLAMLWIAFTTVFSGASREFRPGRGARIAVAAAFTVVFVHSLTYAALLEDPLTWVLLGCALGLAAIPRAGAAESGGDDKDDETNNEDVTAAPVQPGDQPAQESPQ
jgi:hypothetical protein